MNGGNQIDMRHGICQGALVTACAVLRHRRNCRFHHHHHHHRKIDWVVDEWMEWWRCVHGLVRLTELLCTIFLRLITFLHFIAPFALVTASCIDFPYIL